MITRGPIPLGKTVTIIDEISTGGSPGQQEIHASVESDSVLVSLFAEVVSGTLDVSVYTLTEEGKETEVISFPQLTAPTSELLLKKAAVVMSRIKVVATYTGNSTFEVRARGINAGETSVKVLGASDGRASQITIATTPTLIIPVSLSDRAGLVIKNFSTSKTIYLGFTAGEATASNGYPLGPGEAMAMDVAAGVTLYAVSDSPSTDLRILEAGA